MAEATPSGVRSVNDRPIEVYPLDNYTFGAKAAMHERDRTITERFLRLRKEYLVSGMRRTVEAVIVTHHFNMPHVLLLKIGATFFKLPGGVLEDDEDEVDGLRRHLSSFFGVPLQQPPSPKKKNDDEDEETKSSSSEKSTKEPTSAPLQCQIREVVANWWRPNFEPTQYPYLPAHITKPKEHRRLLLVEMPPSCVLHVPSNYNLVAAPLFELFDNTGGYGPVIASLALSLSKFNFVYKS